MNDCIVILIFLVIHWFADFACQPRWMGKGKSKSNLILLAHVTFYCLCFVAIHPGIYEMMGFSVERALAFIGITFVTHFSIDYFTSRLGSYLWAKGKEYESLLVLGFDQLLHGAQLILTYYFLTN